MKSDCALFIEVIVSVRERAILLPSSFGQVIRTASIKMLLDNVVLNGTIRHGILGGCSVTNVQMRNLFLGELFGSWWSLLAHVFAVVTAHVVGTYLSN